MILRWLRLRSACGYFLAFLSLAFSACLDQSVQIPQAPVETGSPNGCGGKHDAFVESGSLIAGRADHTATLLTDGRVLLTDGYSIVDRGSQLLNSTEMYDPAKGDFQSAASMGMQRKLAAAVRLPDGRILISGGYDQLGGVGLGARPAPPLDSSELYDPSTNAVQAGPRMLRGRAGHSAVLLDNGKALVGGGLGVAFETLVGSAAPGNPGVVELFDPDTGQFSAAGKPNERHPEEEAIKLADGNVLLYCGGRTAEIYDPAKGSFAKTGEQPKPLSRCAGSLLSDGRVLIVGTTATPDRIAEVPQWRVQIYDPRAGTFSWGPNQAVEISEPKSVTLSGDRVLILGDVRPDYANVLTGEIFDGERNAFSVVGGVHPNRNGFSATNLSDGNVLIVGGSASTLPYNVRQSLLFCQ